MARIYGWVAYLGLMTVSASLLVGFRHDPTGRPEGTPAERRLYVSVATLAGLLGIADAGQTHSASGATPLLTAGSYAGVRHPMYRGAVFMCLASLLVQATPYRLWRGIW